MKQGILHHLFISNNLDSQQLLLSTVYHHAVLQMLHHDHGHQGLHCTLALTRERFYWGAVYKDVVEYVAKCYRCQVTVQICTCSQSDYLPIIPWTCCVLT